MLMPTKCSSFAKFINLHLLVLGQLIAWVHIRLSKSSLQPITSTTAGDLQNMIHKRTLSQINQHKYAPGMAHTIILLGFEDAADHRPTIPFVDASVTLVLPQPPLEF